MKNIIIACLMVLTFISPEANACPDFDDNGKVDTADFLLFVDHFRTTEPRYDLNADGKVSIADFLIFMDHYGKKCPEKDPRTSFNIDVVFVDGSDFTEAEKEIIQQAARRWEQIIVGDLPDTDYSNDPVNIYDETLRARIVVNDVIDDVRIFVNNVTYLSDRGLWGRAGPRWFLKSEAFKPPSIGVVVIDYNNREYTKWYESERRFFRLVTHEMGHVLGIGLAGFKRSGFLKNHMTRNTDTHFNGPRAVKAFDEAGGKNYSGEKVPVQKIIAGHWRTDVLGDELMTHKRVSPYRYPISAITIQALADLGYKVDVSKADPYRLPSVFASKPTTTTIEFGCLVTPK